MHHFSYQNGMLHAEDVSLDKIASEVGTPFYVYSKATLERHFKVYSDALTKAGMDHLICFAIKSNSNLSVLSTLGAMGAGADIVSEGELRRALAAGIPPEKIIFSGVGKSRQELEFALSKNILQINVESEEELVRLSAIACELEKETKIAIRVNPDVDAKTHAKIATGKKENKFGIDIDKCAQIYSRAQSLPGVKPVSIAVHIGSQLTDLGPFRAAFAKVAESVRTLRKLGIEINHVDLGGGLGIPYKGEDVPHPDGYAQCVAEAFKDLDVKVCIEPGRLIVGNAGLLVSRVEYIKHGDHKRFIIADAGMNDLIRPTLYEGYHEVLMVNEARNQTHQSKADVVGPVCETGDTFATDRDVEQVEEGDLIAFGSAGAYGAVMSSTYNTRLLVPEVMVNGDQYAVIRPRQSFEDLLSLDKMAPWQDPAKMDDALT